MRPFKRLVRLVLITNQGDPILFCCYILEAVLAGLWPCKSIWARE